MKIYTRTGDAGDTTLFGGGRVSKDHPRVAAYGAVDELNAAIGWALTQIDDAQLSERLLLLQHDLFAIGSTLATVPREDGKRHPHLPPVPSQRTEEMEAWIDEATGELPELREFVLPGGTPGAAALHRARTTCRRAERKVVHLALHEAVEEDVIVYLNRLGDLLFSSARLANHRAGQADVTWKK
jgi:cob(I)alamin adenosyltransferase